MSDIGNRRALLVIDAQASFSALPYWDETDVATYLAAQNRLISGFLARDWPLVRIIHVDPEGAFSRASGLLRPLAGLLDFQPDLSLEKHAHSAFAGTALSAWLIQRGIRRVTVSGIRSEQCCETTTRDASDRGFEVDYVTEATLTFAMTARDGRRYTSAEIKQRCELVLDGRFARICTVDDALQAAATALPQAA